MRRTPRVLRALPRRPLATSSMGARPAGPTATPRTTSSIPSAAPAPSVSGGGSLLEGRRRPGEVDGGAAAQVYVVSFLTASSFFGRVAVLACFGWAIIGFLLG